MSIMNRLYNSLITVSPVSHLDTNGQVKTTAQFKQDIKEKSKELYQEHESMQAYASKTALEIGCNKLAEAYNNFTNYQIIDGIAKLGASTLYISVSPLALVTPVNSIQLYKENLVSLSPASHLDERGKLKPKQQYKADFKNKLGEIYAEHEEMAKYDQSSYPELVLGNIGKSCTDLYNLNPIKAGYHLSLAAAYGTAGIISTTTHLLSSIANKAYNSISSHIHTGVDTKSHNILAADIDALQDSQHILTTNGILDYNFDPELALTSSSVLEIAGSNLDMNQATFF